MYIFISKKYLQAKPKVKMVRKISILTFVRKVFSKCFGLLILDVLVSSKQFSKGNFVGIILGKTAFAIV